jgi:Domain of unknown function (DU1801)
MAKQQASKKKAAPRKAPAKRKPSARQAKTVPTKVDVQAFLDRVEGDERRADCKALAKLMARITGEKPCMWGPGIVGFGTYHYRYESGHEGDCARAAFAPRKGDLTIYLMPGFTEQGDLLKKLGKHKTGKCCLYVKRLADVDPKVLEQLVRRSLADLARLYPSPR